MIRSDLVFSTIDQNVIAASLVDYANGNNITGGSVDPVAGPGIQLVGNTSGPLTIDRDRTYVGNERKFLGEAIRDFIQILAGPVYRLEHSDRKSTRLNSSHPCASRLPYSA